MRLPLKPTDCSLVDSDSKTIVFDVDANTAHLGQIARAVNSHAALVEALEAVLPLIEQFHGFCKDKNRPCSDPDAECPISMGEWVETREIEAVAQAKAALAAAKGEADASN